MKKFAVLVFCGLLSLGIGAYIGASPSGTFPVDQIAERLGETRCAERCASVPTEFGEIFLVGEEHNVSPFLELNAWLIQEALQGRLILFKEGLTRDPIAEENFRISQGGVGNEAIYGLESPAAQLIDLAIMCRYKAIGLIKGYEVPCREAIVNFSAIETMGGEVWATILTQIAPKNSNLSALIAEVDQQVKFIQSKATLQEKLDAFDLVVENGLPQIAHYDDSVAWDGLYALIGRTALTKAPSMPPDLHSLVQILLSDTFDASTIPALISWFSLNSAYRETVYAQNVSTVLSQQRSPLPRVVVIGGNHLKGMQQLLEQPAPTH